MEKCKRMFFLHREEKEKSWPGSVVKLRVMIVRVGPIAVHQHT